MAKIFFAACKIILRFLHQITEDFPYLVTDR